MKKTKAILLVAATAGILGACSDAKKELGLETTPPDEFSVVTRAPLSVPPDYTLRPPQPGAQRPMELSVRDEARKTVFGADTPSEQRAPRTTGQEEFLGRLGADETTNIRTVVDKESKTIAEEEKPVADKLLFWKKDQPRGKVIDPVEEKEKLDSGKAGVTVEKRNNEDILEAQ